MERKAVPNPVSSGFPKSVHDGFARVGGGIIYHQMDGIENGDGSVG
jgi:hypothetical protein